MLATSRRRVIFYFLLFVIPAALIIPYGDVETGRVSKVEFTTNQVLDSGYKDRYLKTSVVTSQRSVMLSVLSKFRVPSKVKDENALSRAVSWRTAEVDVAHTLNADLLSMDKTWLVRQVTPGSAADKAGVRAADEVILINGLAPASPGLMVYWEKMGKDLRLKTISDRGAKTRTITLKADPNSKRAPYGFWYELAPKADAAYNIKDKTFGGPSAGLILYLAGLDARTSGSLTAGRVVSGTGWLTGLGQVSGVGRADLKIRAAIDAGAEIFFVPEENYLEAEAAAEKVRAKIKIIPVTAEIDAVNWLCRHGGKAVGVCSK